ncbi:hypothetical protein MexAM1_META1p3247 [Methylorubrum extorquens AM1]|uniref:Uncharacterized protein n=1 Tax=Methylorubrum extorquens (strain ATCC 14718 / DSM 1338 / JCM 2805 / NCIMB 9133 / AM1) TaxID=272630 RepID=C5AWY5_METEA|nr:hypothetical protein MexAM1_META1p3247 [Methylorubrum extorquens AM1]
MEEQSLRSWAASIARLWQRTHRLNLMSGRGPLERVVYAASRELFTRDGARRHPRVVELARLDYSLADDRR